MPTASLLPADFGYDFPCLVEMPSFEKSILALEPKRRTSRFKVFPQELKIVHWVSFDQRKSAFCLFFGFSLCFFLEILCKLHTWKTEIYLFLPHLSLPTAPISVAVLANKEDAIWGFSSKSHQFQDFHEFQHNHLVLKSSLSRNPIPVKPNALQLDFSVSRISALV